MLKLLLQNGADANATDRNNRPALMIAAQQANALVINMLLKHGADPNFQTSKDDSCLHRIVRSRPHNLRQIVKVLVDNKANVNVANSEGQTPLYNAVRCNNKQNVDILIEHGADVNFRDHTNRTPLHLAAACHVNKKTDFDNQHSILNMLLQNDAVINACDCYGFTPLNLTLNYELNSIAKACLLIRHGAIVQDPRILENLVWVTDDEFQRPQLLSVLLKAGLNPQIIVSKLQESYPWLASNKTNQVYDKRDKRMIQDLIQQCENVLSLQWLCRIVIRQEILLNTPGSSIHKFIHRLPLPQILQDFLALMDRDNLDEAENVC